MKDVIYTPQPDGSAILEVDLTPEEVEIFVGLGIRKCLEDFIKEKGTEIEDEPTGHVCCKKDSCCSKEDR